MHTVFLSTLATVLLACGLAAPPRETEASSDVITKMAQDTKQGRYEEAIQAGVNALENKPSDDGILRQIAIIYLVRAEKDAEHSEQWVKQATIFAERSLSIHPAVDIGRYETARIYEHAGDLAKENKCSLYLRALQPLADWTSTLKGETLSVEGKDYPTAPLLREAQSTKDRIEGKQAQSHCN